MSLPAPHQWSPATPAPTLAGYGRRILAWVVDLLIFVVPAFLVVVATVDLDAADPVAHIPLAVSAAFAVAFVAYQTIMVAWRGQTVGAMSMSIQVIRVDSHQKPGWQASAIRALVPQVAGVVPLIGPVLLVVIHCWMFFDPRRQGLQDKAAGTIVVSAIH